jgi:hypothetical protein
MTVEKNRKHKSMPKSKHPDTEHKYNPVNMADKKIEIGEQQSHENTQAKEDYNPVNMAGKKADILKKA